MTQRPWWFSGDEAAEDARQSGGGVDFGALAFGASQVVEWARSLIVAPHADHDDPREHPQCPLCRASQLFAQREHAPAPAPGHREIDWFEVTWAAGEAAAIVDEETRGVPPDAK